MGIKAKSFLTVCKEHKEKCDGDCGVSMFSLGEVYKDLVKRKLTEDEESLFI